MPLQAIQRPGKFTDPATTRPKLSTVMLSERADFARQPSGADFSQRNLYADHFHCYVENGQAFLPLAACLQPSKLKSPEIVVNHNVHRIPYRPGKTIWWVSGNSCVSGKSMFSDISF